MRLENFNLGYFLFLNFWGGCFVDLVLGWGTLGFRVGICCVILRFVVCYVNGTGGDFPSDVLCKEFDVMHL